MADAQKFLADLQSDNADSRFAAWRQAGEMPPSVIPQLGKLAASDNPGVAKAGREALTTMVHSVGADPAAPNRAGVAKGLLDLSARAQPLPVRVLAFRLLSNIAGEDAVPALAKSLAEPDVREEAIYCIERIPGSASDKVLIAACRDARDDFKPRILAALGHRRVAEAAALCSEATRSSSKDVAVAGMKAFGRIGGKVSAPVRQPDAKGMTEWDRTESTDALLRYADAQAKEGNAAEAMRVYRTALERPEEHLQCAAIIGMARLATPEAIAAILPKLKAENARVRITAANAWKGVAAGKA